MLYCIAHLLKPLSMNEIPSVIFICVYWALLCQKVFVGKKEGSWHCLAAFLGIFGPGAFAVVSYWIACFLQSTKRYISLDVWCQHWPGQCSRACSLVYFPWALSSGHVFYYPRGLVCHFLLKKVELSLLAEWSEGNVMQRDEGKWRNAQFWEMLQVEVHKTEGCWTESSTELRVAG